MYKRINLLSRAMFFLLVVLFPLRIEAAPTITSITPNTGDNVDSIEITELLGDGFEDGTEVFLKKEGQLDLMILDKTVLPSTVSGILNCMGAEPGIWDVVVINPDGQSATLIAGFTLTSELEQVDLTITSIMPDEDINSGITEISELFGTGFEEGAVVTFRKDNQPDIALSITILTSSMISGSFDAAGAGPGAWDLVVTNPNGESVTLAAAFTLTEVPEIPETPEVIDLTINSIMPNEAINSGITEISELYGTGFEEGAVVALRKDNQPDIAVSVTTLTSSMISGSFNAAGAGPGAWDLVVTNPNGESVTLAAAFTLTEVAETPETPETPEAPEIIDLAITSIIPNTGYNWGINQVVELQGTGFEDGILVNLTQEGQPDINVVNTTESPSSIRGFFDIRGAEAGVWDVVATNPDGNSVTLADGFTLNAYPAPVVTSNSPDLTENMGIINVDVIGDHFLEGAHVKLIKEGQPDVDSIYVLVSNSSNIICKFNVTGVEPGHWDVVVTNPDGQSGISNSIDITEAQISADCAFIPDNAEFYVDADALDANGDGSLSSPWKTITQALDYIAGCLTSPTGVIVHVAPGTYDVQLGESFPITMIDGVSLFADEGPDSTILDAQGSNQSVITCYGLGSGETIDGFTIENGNAVYGGGVNCNGSSPTLNNNIIISNNASTFGGGIYAYSSPNLLITNCTITGNTASSSGGGVYISSSNSVTLLDSEVSGNGSGGHGGGIYAATSNYLTLTRTAVSGNTAASNGGGLYLTSSHYPNFTNCEITKNDASSSGGGIYFVSSTVSRLTNCTIAYNRCTNYGSGVYYSRGNQDKIKNSILWWNMGGLSKNQFYGTIPTSITYSNIERNTGIQSGDGNINQNPLFVSVSNDNFSPGYGSPCIDSGTDVGAPSDDIAGNVRPYEPNPPEGGYVPKHDMGAIEAQLTPADVCTSCNYLTITVDAAGGGDYLSIQEGIDAAVDGDTVSVLGGTYNERINLLGKQITVITTEGAVIDGSGLSGSVVTFNSYEDRGSVLDGFTITNGNATDGGGIYAFYASPTIKDCIVTSNNATSGGGIYLSRSMAEISGCDISSNTSTSHGGGIYGTYSPVHLIDCTIRDNHATANNGGGAYFGRSSGVRFTGCVLDVNTAKYGAAVSLSYSYAALFSDCAITANTASSSGGGVYISSSYSVTFLDSEISGNGSGGHGGGIYATTSYYLIII